MGINKPDNHKGLLRDRMRKDGFFDGRFKEKTFKSKVKYTRGNKGANNRRYLEEFNVEDLEDQVSNPLDDCYEYYLEYLKDKNE